MNNFEFKNKSQIQQQEQTIQKENTFNKEVGQVEQENNIKFKSLNESKNEKFVKKSFENNIFDCVGDDFPNNCDMYNNSNDNICNNKNNNDKICDVEGVAKKTKLTKKIFIEGFQLVDLLWYEKSEGRHKYKVLVRYIDPEGQGTKRSDKSYQKIIKFGQKGVEDYIDPPFSLETKDKNVKRLKSNIDNPLHENYYVINLLNGDSNDIEINFNNLKYRLFKK